jgi:hypothetical protein
MWISYIPEELFFGIQLKKILEENCSIEAPNCVIVMLMFSAMMRE